MTMRKNVETLIHSGISTYRIARESGVPESTVTRIWRGDTQLDNVKFSTVEKLEQFYLENKRKNEKERRR